MLLLDTHIWVWFLQGSRDLPPRLRRAIERSLDACHLSAISTWELAMLAARGRVTLDREIEDWTAAARDHLPVIEEPVTARIAMASMRLPLETQDPADRLIAATAQIVDLTLVTVDAKLRRIPGVRTLTN